MSPPLDYRSVQLSNYMTSGEDKLSTISSLHTGDGVHRDSDKRRRFFIQYTHFPVRLPFNPSVACPAF